MIVSINPKDLLPGQSYRIVCPDGSSMILPFVRSSMTTTGLYHLFLDEEDGDTGIAHCDFNTGHQFSFQIFR
jgi:hypothetical protein